MSATRFKSGFPTAVLFKIESQIKSIPPFCISLRPSPKSDNDNILHACQNLNLPNCESGF